MVKEKNVFKLLSLMYLRMAQPDGCLVVRTQALLEERALTACVTGQEETGKARLCGWGGSE